MPSVANPPVNGSCPRNCSCSALFLNVIIQRASSTFSGLDQLDTQTMTSRATEIYWNEKSVQLSCKLDCSLPLPPCMVYDIGQYVEDAIASAMDQSPLSIASDSDATVLMPSDDEEAPPDLNSTVLKPGVDLTVEDEPPTQQQVPIITRSALKRLRINQPQTTMTQYYDPPEEQKNKKKNKKRLKST
jgi:hypothetical protein